MGENLLDVSLFLSVIAPVSKNNPHLFACTQLCIGKLSVLSYLHQLYPWFMEIIDSYRLCAGIVDACSEGVSTFILSSVVVVSCLGLCVNIIVSSLSDDAIILGGSCQRVV